MSKFLAKVTINDNRFMTIESRDEHLDKIDQIFTYDDMSMCFVNGAFRGENVRKRKFLVRKKNIPNTALLPIGFREDLEKLFKLNGAVYKITDNRKFDSFDYTEEEIKSNLDYLELYDYQIEAVQACLEKRGGVVRSPTGSGKTEMFISLCNLMKKKTLILFARIDLAHQTLRRMKKAGIDAGIVQGNNIDEDHLVVMATVQSGHKLRQKYEMVIVDECHRASSEQYQEILRASMFTYRFGFSATPWVKDKYKNARVKSFLGSEIVEVHPKRLMDAEKIAKPTIHIWPIDRPTNIDNYKWQGAETHGIVNNSYRNQVIAKLCEKDPDAQILVLVKRIDQGKNLEELVPNSFFLHGENKTQERQDLVKRFETGEKFVLIASTIFDEGIDIKNVSHVIIAGGGSSFIKALQRVGRGTRITDTKKEVDIYDFWDDTNPTLLRHSRERVKIYKKYGFEQIEFHPDAEVKKLLL